MGKAASFLVRRWMLDVDCWKFKNGMFAEQAAGDSCILSLRVRQNLTCLQRVLEFKDSSVDGPDCYY